MVFFLWRLEQDLGETAQAGNLKPKRTVLGIKKEGLYGLLFVVPGTGLEPALLSEHAPETCASTNSATRASGRVPFSRNLVVKKNNR